MLLPRHPLVQARFDRLPFRSGAFGGLWLSGTFDHLPRAAWRSTFMQLLGFLAAGPIYLSCVRGAADLVPVQDPTLGQVYLSGATEQEIGSLLSVAGVTDLTVEVRPHPIFDRRRPLVVALGRIGG